VYYIQGSIKCDFYLQNVTRKIVFKKVKTLPCLTNRALGGDSLT
jgi:hypothetical protein